MKNFRDLTNAEMHEINGGFIEQLEGLGKMFLGFITQIVQLISSLFGKGGVFGPKTQED